jgi:holo-[acyl-carrier protein] synthase
MICGAGIDVTPIARVARLVRDHRAQIERIFTASERTYCEGARASRRDGRYAATFAAKEAVLKALGTGWRSDLEWSDIDTRGASAGAPIELSGGVRREAERQGLVRIFVSAAVTSATAVAAAVSERD